MPAVSPYWALPIAFLLGSIPTSYLIGKIFFKTDIRTKGSGNTGATNALRTLGTVPGLIVLIIDILKGMAAVMIAVKLDDYNILGNDYSWLVNLSAILVIAGHIFTPFLGFKGGKGVAAAAGVFLYLDPVSFLLCIFLFIFIVILTKYVSLGSIMAGAALMLIEVMSQLINRSYNLPKALMVIVAVFLIIYRHKENIRRLIAGSEHKFNLKKS